MYVFYNKEIFININADYDYDEIFIKEFIKYKNIIKNVNIGKFIEFPLEELSKKILKRSIDKIFKYIYLNIN